MLRFDHTVCGDLGQALRREWLETNGIGGFASSTIVGLDTRRYHGLLTAALHPPGDRYLLLAKLEEPQNALVVDVAASPATIVERIRTSLGLAR